MNVHEVISNARAIDAKATCWLDHWYELSGPGLPGQARRPNRCAGLLLSDDGQLSEPLDEFKKVFFGVFDKEGRETRITSCPAKGSSDREKHLCWFYPRLARA
jgi:hypothetical protein